MKTLTYEHAKSLRDKGRTILQIARDYAISPQRVYQILDRKYNVKRRERALSPHIA